LQFSWVPVCINREFDGICAVKNMECTLSSFLECDIVKEAAKKFERDLNLLIERNTQSRPAEKI
jgi:hypothetical protein